MARKDIDPLQVEASVIVEVPPQLEGKVRITKKLLNSILIDAISGKQIPENVHISLFWRNPARKGSLSFWRYHHGANLRNAPTPRESRPRGSLQDALFTLANFITTGAVTFH